MMLIKNLILDLDGPVLETRKRLYQCYSEALRAYGDTPLELSDYWSLKRKGISAADINRLTDAKVPPDIFKTYWLKRIENEDLLALDFVQPDALSALEALNVAKINVTIATLRKNHEGVLAQLARLKVFNLLNNVLVCNHDDGAFSKVNAVTSSMPNLDPDSTLWIGDTEIDIQASRKLGCKVWAVSCGIRDENFLQQLHPDYIYKDLFSCMQHISRAN